MARRRATRKHWMMVLAIAITALWLAVDRGPAGSDLARFLTIVGLPLAGMLMLAWMFARGSRRRSGAGRRGAVGSGQTLILP